MDFRSATEEVSNVEKNAIPYTPPKIGKYTAERMLELSPPDISGMEYADAVNLYKRMEKILSASRIELGMSGEEAPEARAPSKASLVTAREARAVEEEMKKISTESAKEAEKISALPSIQETIEEAPAPPAPAEEEAPEEVVSVPAHEEPEIFPEEEEKELPLPSTEEEKKPVPAPREAPPLPQKAGEGIAIPPQQPAAPPAPALKKATGAPPLGIPLPAMLEASPLKKAEETVSRIEAQLGAQMTGKTTKKVDVGDTKKRMIELTRELFKERSMDRRAEIKKEIVMLKSLIAEGTGGKAESGGLPKGALCTALLAEQQYELRDAMGKLQDAYETKRKELAAEMDAHRAVHHREPAFESFSKSMVELEHRLTEIADKYQAFLIAKHSAELAKLKSRGQETPESEALRQSLRDSYSHEFSSLKASIGERIHSQLETTREILFESAGDLAAGKVSQAANAPEEELFNLLQAKDSRTYDKYARGEVARADAVLAARRIMAKELGVDEDTINKRFGGK